MRRPGESRGCFVVFDCLLCVDWMGLDPLGLVVCLYLLCVDWIGSDEVPMCLGFTFGLVGRCRLSWVH